MGSGAAAAEVIELSSEDEEPVPVPRAGAGAGALALARRAPSSPPDVKPRLLAGADVKPLPLLPPLLPPLHHPPGYGALVPVKAEEPAPVPVPVATASPPPRALPPPRLGRQFWKSGDYVVARRNPDADAPGGRNRLRINPKFLHSNATSHKWAFGAVAELLDNAIDEMNNGATFVRVNKFTNPRDGNPSLLVQDNGGGMDPEALRRCMSFGFSDKQSDAFIGQYGNGFKTSTMRLGADVIVFTQNQNNQSRTRSIGLLSYTFLMETGCDDVLVPTVDYQYDPVTASFTQMLRHDQRLFSSNLSILLKWSPFASEAELLKQFDDMGEHGTKIIVFNLWFNDDGDMELDFNSDKKDILITGAHKKKVTHNLEKVTTQNYVSTRLRYSLRAYASILYLRVSDNFRIILRECDVEPHNIVNDLMYRECVLYKPQIAGLTEPSVITTIGFVKGAPDIDVQGFNVYHKNRLIMPFWKVANNSYGKGRGVVGILEANFIKPTHDKQDFEKSVMYQRLEIRLKEMTYEYWDLHCHRVGYDNKKLSKATRALNRASHMNAGSSPISAPPRLFAADVPTSSCAIPRLSASAARERINNFESLPKSKTGLKRKFDSSDAMTDSADRDGLDHTDRVNQDVSQRKRFNEYRTLTLENDKLRNECLQYEESEKQLVLKEQKLRSQIEEARKKYQELSEELRSLDVKKEK
ncbi:protein MICRORCHIDIA 6-like [Phragmites australis]|uniref:protein MICRORCHIDIA 6-like n=1 Tax=Phragmites australis TaxID=29695 RepID=UPI002D769F5D|nr:protein MICRORCHIDIA 6-like [Phragmites australis]